MTPETFINIGIGLSTLLIIVLSFKGKISPLLTLTFLLVAAFTAILIYSSNLWGDNSIAARRAQSIPTTALKDSTLTTSTEETDELPATLEKRNPADTLSNSRDYKVTDSKYWNYKIAGFWNWNTKFKDNLFTASGWSYQKKGNYTIEVGHTGKFKNDQSQNEQRFIYTGGDLEIKVNNSTCCCQGKLMIKAGISGKNLAEVKNNIQKEIDSIMEKDDSLVIQKIISCL